MKKTFNSQTPGTPNPIPTLPINSEEEDNALFHGSHGAQGGEQGNEYQAVWMTLACINATYQLPSASQLTEIILEGSREPFDDIEIKKSNNSLTLFQSKHRNQAGSNNVTIAQLVEEPGGKDTAPFSLLKYFKGMMKILQEESLPQDNRFIVCISASFAEKFKDPNDKKKFINLGKDFWSTSGIFQEISEEQKESLLCNIHFSQENKETIANYLSNKKLPIPRYVRFSEKFINNELDENGITLRNYIYRSLVNFVKNERKENTWIYWPPEETNKKIKAFFQTLQLWIDQPKLQVLSDIVTTSLKINFVFGVEEVQARLLEVIKQSSDRHKQSLKQVDIHHYLTQVRGAILGKYLGVMSDQFKDQHLLDNFLSIGYSHEELLDFLKTSDEKVCIISAKDFQPLKFLLYGCIQQYYAKNNQNHRFSENWFLVNFNTKPFFHQDQGNKKFIDHQPEDIFIASFAELVIIDEAHGFLIEEYGQKIINRLAVNTHKSNTKLILLTSEDQIKNLTATIGNSYKKIIIQDTCFPIETVKQSITQAVYNGFGVEFFEGQIISLAGIANGQYQSFLSAFSALNLLSSVLKDAYKFAPEITTLVKSKKIFGLDHYQALPLPVSQPVYNLVDICRYNFVKKVRVLIEKENLENALEQVTKLKWGFNKKEKRYFVNLNKEGRTIEVELQQPETLDRVVVKKIDDQLTNHLLELSAVDFIDKANPKTSTKGLLTKSLHPRRMLLSAEYGSGKSTLLLYLLQEQLHTTPTLEHYDWVLLIRLPEVLRKISTKGVNLIEVIISEAQKLNLIKGEFKDWKKCVLTTAIQNGKALLLFDGWDVLTGADVKRVNQWLTKLPPMAHFIIGTRPHAQNNLTIPIHEKVSISLFTWKEVEQYILGYFKNYLHEKDNNPNTIATANHNRFVKKVLAWLGRGNNDEANEVLARPLHVTLLCEALIFYYDQWLLADQQKQNEIGQQAPWGRPTFYRTKLYQMVLLQQYRKYIVECVQVKSLPYSQSDHHVIMLTQLPQLRMRELGFQEIFAEKPIQLVHYFDKDILDNELYHLGLINKVEENETNITSSCFAHRIFQEYSTAQYILAGLTRGEEDSYYRHVQNIINKTHNDPRYEQVWRILGEMIRYGDVFLNFKALGKDIDVISKMPALNDHDLIGARMGFFRNCLNGKDYSCSILTNAISSTVWFEKAQPTQDEEEEQPHYDESSLEELLELAKKSKNEALSIIKFLLAEKQLSNSWLEYFYCNQKEFKEIDFETTDLKFNCEMNTLYDAIKKIEWPEYAWGSYWDVDTYLPAVGLMTKKLFTVAAAYFIHRIENRNNVYYSTQIPSRVSSVLQNLASANFDIESNRLFLMMIQVWLRKSYIINQQSPCPILLNMLEKIWRNFNEDESYRWLAVDTLFALGFIFKIAITLKQVKGKDYLCIQLPLADEQEKVYELTEKRKHYILMRFEYLKSKSDFIEMKLPPIAWDATEFENDFQQQFKQISSTTLSKFNSPIHLSSQNQKAESKSTNILAKDRQNMSL